MNNEEILLDKLICYIEEEKYYYEQSYQINPRYIKIPEDYLYIIKKEDILHCITYKDTLQTLCGLIVCPSRDVAKFENIEIF